MPSADHAYFRAQRVLLQIAENEDEETHARILAASLLLEHESVPVTKQGITTDGFRDSPEEDSPGED